MNYRKKFVSDPIIKDLELMPPDYPTKGEFKAQKLEWLSRWAEGPRPIRHSPRGMASYRSKKDYDSK